MNKKLLAIDQLIKHMWNEGEFARIQSVYQLLDWKWATSAGLRVPSISDIEEKIKNLLLSLDEPGVLSTGGVRVELFNEEDGDFVYNVSMTIDMGEIYEEDVVSDEKQIVVLDSRNNPLDILSTQEKDGKIYVRVKNQNNFDKTNNYFTTNDYGLDEYPLTDEWAKSFTKYKNKSKNNE
jgi:hypothetical protein